MSHTLPSNRTLRDLEKEARGLLDGLRKREAGAVSQSYLLDSEASGFQGRLADAQYIIARKYGYKLAGTEAPANRATFSEVDSVLVKFLILQGRQVIESIEFR